MICIKSGHVSCNSYTEHKYSRDEGALGPGQGQERQEVEEIQEHGHWSPGAEHGLQLQRAQAVMLGLLLSLSSRGIDVFTIMYIQHIFIFQFLEFDDVWSFDLIKCINPSRGA